MSILKMKPIETITPAQILTVQAFNEGKHLALHGLAGTGKTYLTLGLCLAAVERGQYSKVVIVRSMVSTRDIGFLPGTEGEKMEAFEAPYLAICNDLYDKGKSYVPGGVYKQLKDNQMIEFMSTSFIRGTTWNDCLVLIDESENMNFHELDSIITRTGQNCRMIFCGDVSQTDLIMKKNDTTGITSFYKILERIKSFAVIEFGIEDIVRSDVVRDYLIEKNRPYSGSRQAFSMGVLKEHVNRNPVDDLPEFLVNKPRVT